MAAAVLDAAVNKLEEVDFSDSRLTVQQINEILHLSVKTDSKLKTLHFNILIEYVDSDIVKEANKKLEITFNDEWTISVKSCSFPFAQRQ